MTRILGVVVVCSFVLAATSAFAQPVAGGPGAGATTVITKAVPDFSNPPMPQVIIHGDNFGTTPVVSLGDVLGNFMLLTVDSATDTEIVADLPVVIEAGSYMLIVEAATGATSTGIIDVTIGTVGPQGPPGQDGAPGLQGLPGSEGPEGPAGTPNPNLITESTPTFNTAIGVDALISNTTGFSNTATGNGALLFNTTGFNNTASGRGALQSNTTGWQSTASAHAALASNTTGTGNTASGAFALVFNTTGSANTAIGGDALFNNATGDSNTASGASALNRNKTGSNNTASGRRALVLNTTGFSNTAIGSGALLFNNTGSGNTAIGAFANVSSGNLTNATAIGANAIVNASNKIRLGSSAVSIIEGQVPFIFTSDRNQKENFQPLDGHAVLEKIRAIPVQSWNYIGQDPTQFRHYGPVAQDFFAAFGHDDLGTIGTPTTINSGDMQGILMIAVQALETRTAAQRETITKLEADNADLKTRLEDLEKRVLAKEALLSTSQE